MADGASEEIESSLGRPESHVSDEPDENETCDFLDMIESLKFSLDTPTVEKLCEYFKMTSLLEKTRVNETLQHQFLLQCRRDCIITRKDTTKLLEAFRENGLLKHGAIAQRSNLQQIIEDYDQISKCPNVRVTVNNDNPTSAFSNFKRVMLSKKRAIKSVFRQDQGIHYEDCKEGSLVICLKVSSVEGLDKLKAYIESEELLRRLIAMYESKISDTERKDFQSERSSIKLCYDTEEFENAYQQLTTNSFNSSRVRKMDNQAGFSSSKVRKMDNQAGFSSSKVRKMDNQAGSSSRKVRKMDNQSGVFEARMANSTYQRPLHPIRDYSIVLVGKTGCGKSSTGNTILGRTAFTAEPSGEYVTGVSSYATSEYGDRTITVVDTPGVHDNVRPDDVIKQEYARVAFLLQEGVHCFVICMNASEVRVTKGTQQFLDALKGSGHVDFFDYCMLVYTIHESKLCDISLDEVLEKQKENADMKSFLEKIGDRVLAVNNKTNDPRQKTRNQDDIIAMVDKVIENNMIKNKPETFTNDTFKKAKELRDKVVSVVESENCHPSLVNAVVEAGIWFSKLGTIAEKEFVEKVITILCESDQCEENGTNLVFRNGEEVISTPVVDYKEHIRVIYQETESLINVFYQMLGTIYEYTKSFLLTAGAVAAGAGLVALVSSTGGQAAIIVMLGVASRIFNKKP